MLRQKSLLQLCIVAIVAALMSISVQAYELLGTKWPTPQTTLSVDIVGASPTGGTWNSAMSQATSDWNSRVAGFTINSQQVMGNPCAGWIPEFPEDFLHSVAFASDLCGDPFGTSTLAVTITFFGDGETIDSDIIFNSNKSWDIYHGAAIGSIFDFRRVAAHELGHVLGLGHESVVPALMNPFFGPIEVPQADDIAGANALYPDSSVASVIVSLEEPSQDQIASGVTNIRGWAVATTDIDRVELWLDGSFWVNVAFGGTRADVGNAFPEYPNSADSGFSMAMAWGLLDEGTHTMTARAYDNNGGFEDSMHSFTVTTFDNPFIKPPATVVIDASSGTVISDAGSAVTINKITADGKDYQVKLKWNTATQQFNINQITPLP